MQDRHMTTELDRYITGNYGEDQFNTGMNEQEMEDLCNKYCPTCALNGNCLVQTLDAVFPCMPIQTAIYQANEVQALADAAEAEAYYQHLEDEEERDG